MEREILVDFRKKLGKTKTELKINPIEIYDSLDWQSDKSVLSPAQVHILNKWFNHYRENKDIVLKLNTGQGKTIIGLLILQSYLNDKKGSVVYLCPDKYLLDQTCQQADMFGIKYCLIKDDIPDELLDGTKILITTCSKLFNGKSKFGIGSRSITINTILMDDAHQCIEYIKDTYKITLSSSHKAYNSLLTLFENDIREQGQGTYQEIKRNDNNAFLPIPYWTWIDNIENITKILVRYKDDNELLFSWPLIKDDLINCECIISGDKLEIYPSVSLINKFGSYNYAEHRIFMSATIVDDSYLIKGLGISIDAIKKPLTYDEEKWSGEKMILIPSMIDDKLNREEIIAKISNLKNKKFGVVILAPSFNRAKNWENYGVETASKGNIYSKVSALKSEDSKKPLVIVNRYDGIDLPDNVCRLLVMDSLPVCNSLEDKYIESCLQGTEIIKRKVAQAIEQGLGRSVRGSKDYSVIVLIGSDLVSFMRSSKTRDYLSDQTQNQVKIGLDIAKYAVDDIKEEDKEPFVAFSELISQCLNRDEGWKEYYKSEMDNMESKSTEFMLEALELEYLADMDYKNNKYSNACDKIQILIDNYYSKEPQLKGWYLQKMSKYKYHISKADSIRLQEVAYNSNNYLLKPREFMRNNIKPINLKRISNIVTFIKNYKSYEDLLVEFLDNKTKLSFNSNSDHFERAVDFFGKMLGFICVRPDKEYKEGPDNLWQVDNDRYFLIECKNEVDKDRKEISRDEVGQLNTSIAWFNKNYSGVSYNVFMIISTNKLAKGAVFSEQVKIINANKVNKFIEQVRKFILELKKYDINNITEEKVNELINQYKLGYEEFIKLYSLDAKY